jgi:hypothetical protein
MEIISHRRNTRAELDATPPEFGVEIDIRSHGDSLHLQHDPFVLGEPFEEWLSHYRHGTLILNVKEEGLEERVVDLVTNAGIKQYFFLDQSFPFLVRYARRGRRQAAVRVSEYETLETALTLAGLVDWAWIDCMSRFPLDASGARALVEAGFRLCLVSPELHGRWEPEEVTVLQDRLRQFGVEVAAVCTKVPERWRTHG